MDSNVKSSIHEQIVTTWLNGDDRGFNDETDLQGTGILDSFSTLSLVAFIDDTVLPIPRLQELNIILYRCDFVGRQGQESRPPSPTGVAHGATSEPEAGGASTEGALAAAACSRRSASCRA